MKITKYPQSCLVVEKDGHSIAIDPGSFFIAKYGQEDLGPVEAVLYTHQHPDHLDEELAEQLRSAGVNLYGNADVAAKIGGEVEIVTSGTAFEAAGFTIMPHDLPHFQVKDWQMPQNTGYLIDGTFFDPGDSTEASGMTSPDAGIPIGNPAANAGSLKLARDLQAKRIVPIHNANHEFFEFDDQEFVTEAGTEFEVIYLEDGASAEL